MLTRRIALGGLLGLGAGLGTGLTPRRGHAQTFPTRNITIVVPYPAGGPVDAVARLYAEEAAADFGHPVTVDNRGGGSGSIGTAAVARADPDGHTLVLGTNQTHATNQSLLKNCPYDGVTDFAPIAGIAVVPHVLVLRKSLQVKSVAELIESAKKMPDAMNYGSTGNGSASHLTAELFKTQAGIDVRHIPFRGAAPMTTELLAERLDFAFATLPSMVNLIDAGQLKPLAIASAKRAGRLPDVPTMKEAGISGVEADAWFALFAPAKTPQPVIDRLYRSVTTAFAKDKTKDAIAKQGMTLALTPPAQFAAALPGEVKKWAGVIKAANVTVE
jgi:tripartite-type tricarboxylate transporter receptor subunit TctC